MRQPQSRTPAAGGAADIEELQHYYGDEREGVGQRKDPELDTGGAALPSKSWHETLARRRS